MKRNPLKSWDCLSSAFVIFSTSTFQISLDRKSLQEREGKGSHLMVLLTNLCVTLVVISFQIDLGEAMTGFTQYFNADTNIGRRNAAVATLGTVTAILVYKKMTGGSAKVIN